jgi:predicted dehydrogenase
MGKRRIRNLQALGVVKIIGFDPQLIRCQEVSEKYGIQAFRDMGLVRIDEMDAVIISTPPDHHNEWIDFAIKNGKPAFVEASVILEGLPDLDEQAKMSGTLIVPSSTLHFHPAIKIIREIVAGGEYGRVVNFSYHMGQYLPDWHPWEKVGDSYTGKKETSGAREMVAFDLTWLVEIIGFPRDVVGFYGQTMNFGPEIDDTYAIAIKFANAFATFLVDTTARYYIRHLIMNLENAQIMWRWDKQIVTLYNANTKSWSDIPLPVGKAADGYNPNIFEDMYIDEMRAFIEAVNGKEEFPNSLDKDIEILSILYQVERGK